MAGWYVTASDIETWTEIEKRRAEETLPLLVKRLILASSKPKELNFPSGNAITTGGWDGILEVEVGNEFIPTGKSGWEFGTNENINKKANDDYKKRTQNPAPLIPVESTFVFVTSRHWGKRDDWIATKKKSGEWQNIKGINANILENWLEACPAVHRWFACLVGKRTGELWDLDQAWSAFSNVTGLPLTTDFFHMSREETVQKLISRLNGKGLVLRIKALSEREAYGFILASLRQNDEMYARTLIVKNQVTWDQLIESKNTLILIPSEFKPNNMGTAARNGHNIVLALDDRDTASPDEQLSRVSKQIRIAAIQSMGLSKEQAEKVYSDTKGYLEPILRHSLLKPIDKPHPIWSDSVNTDVLFAVLFATEWDINNAEDKKIMALLSAMEYQEFEKEVSKLVRVVDPPVRLVSNIWQVISKMDMWLLIASRLEKSALERLASVFKSVLIDLDPSFDLPPDERYMAGIKGIKPIYSKYIKSGLANSIALLSTCGDNYATQCGTTIPSNLARHCVTQIFEDNIDAKKWYSLGHNLQSLAEAAPQEFLDALEKSTQGATPPIANLFAAEGNGIFGGCPHANLLWAIELISWNKEHLGRSALCLARLSEIDPGGKYSNRPFKSLVDIFIGWINNTKATHKERLEIIEKILLPSHPDISWKLMVSLLLNNTHSTSGIQKPEYRDWADDVEETVLNKDYYEYIDGIVELLIKELKQNPGARLPDIISNFSSYSETQQKIIIERLLGIAPGTLRDDDREKIVTTLRTQIFQHREFRGADWSWPEELLEKLEIIYHKFEFEDVIKKNSYLFDTPFPALIRPIERSKGDWKEEGKLVNIERMQAIEEIFKVKGFDGIKNLILKCNNPEQVGFVVSQSSFSKEAIPHINDWLGNETKLEFAAQTYISVKSVKDWDWAISLLNENKDWNETKKASLLLSLPFSSPTFDLLETQEVTVQSIYWQKINRYFLQGKDENRVNYVASKLLEHNRPLAAIDAMGQILWGKNELNTLDNNLVATILIRIVTDPSDINHISAQNVRHDIIKAIEYVQDQAKLPSEKIAQIEFLYLTVFHEELKPRYLNDMVANDPSFFVQLVKWIYRRKDGVVEIETDLEQIQKQRAEASFTLLRTISVLPGTMGTSIDLEKLNKWVDQTRDLLSQVGRQVTGDLQIGEYLGRCSNGTDGIWPHEAVRQVIERVKSTDLERGIAISRFNSRGATWRSHDEGGLTERQLESAYRDAAKKIELTFPRTACVLRDIADDYAGFARMEDREVELGD